MPTIYVPFPTGTIVCATSSTPLLVGFYRKRKRTLSFSAPLPRISAPIISGSPRPARHATHCLRGADLRGAYLRLAKLDGADLSDVTLEGVKGLPNARSARSGPPEQRNEAPRRLDKGRRCQAMSMSRCSPRSATARNADVAPNDNFFGHPRDLPASAFAKAESPFRDRGTDGSSPSPSSRQSVSPAATFERQEPGLSLQVCEARLTTGSAETQRAFHCAPTGGNVSAGPYSSAADAVSGNAKTVRTKSGVSGL
jgi:hypothetical protein